MHVEEYTPTSEESTDSLLRLRLAFKTAVRLTSLVVRRSHAQAEGAGILFGTAEDGLVNVTAFRSLAVDLPYRSDLPAAEFREAAVTSLAASRFDPEVASLQPVGWYRLHLDGSLDLSKEEMEFHNQISSGRTFTALLLQPAPSGLLAGAVYGSAAGEEISRRDLRRGSINVSTASLGIEAVEVTMRSTSVPGRLLPDTLSRLRQASNWLPRYTDALRSAWGKYPAAFAGAASVLAFVLGIAVAGDGNLASPYARPAQSRQPSLASSASSAAPFALELKREGPNVVITWSNGVKNPTLAYLTISDRAGTTNLNLTSSYRPNGVFLIPGHHGSIDASLSVSDGLDTVQRRASLIEGKNLTGGSGAVAQLTQTSRITTNAASADEVSRLETRNRRLEALITVLQQEHDEEKTRSALRDQPAR